MSIILRVCTILLLIIWTSNAVPNESDPCYYKCRNGDCLPYYWRCDNVPDCDDGSDEENCDYYNDCMEGEFMCKNDGKCLSANVKCDGIDDCFNGSDELGCPSKNDNEFKLSLKLRKTFSTPNEFTKKVVGPIQCYQRNAFLYFTNKSGSIFRFRITDSLHEPSLFKKNAGEGNTITSLTRSPDSNELLFTTKRSERRIMAINDEAEIRTFINHDNERFEHISLDLLTKNLYFIKDGYGIGVCDKDAKNCINLIRASTHQQRFRNLILHNRRGTMFWIQDDSKSIVNIAGMDGKNPRSLNFLNHVYAISLDSENEMLYLANENAIIRVDMRTLFHVEYAKIRASDLLFYNCDLYYIDREIPSIRVVNSQLEDKLITRLDSSDSVFAIVPEEENITQTDPCSSLKCPEICVLSESSIEPGAQCFCKNCAEKHAVETGNLMLSWIIITLLIFVIFGLIVFFLVMYIRLKSKIRGRLDNVPAFNSRLI